MSSKNEKFLKPLREICQKLESDSNPCAHSTDLRMLIAKGAFYEYYSCVELLEILRRNQKLQASNMKEILSLLNVVMHQGCDDKEAMTTQLYNFITKLKDRLDLLLKLIPICAFEKVPKKSSLDVMTLVSEILLRYTFHKCSTGDRKVIYRNYQLITEYAVNDETLLLKVMESYNRAIRVFATDKNWTMAVEFLEQTIFLSLSKFTGKFQKNETFLEFLKMLSMITKYGYGTESVITFSHSLVQVLSKLFTKADHKECSEILTSCLAMSIKQSYSERDLKNLCSEHYKDLKTISSNCNHQKTAIFISRLMANRVRSFEMTESCFVSYHKFVFNLFHILKSIKNEKGIISCCDDIKRHEVHSLIASIYTFATNLANAGIFSPYMGKLVHYHASYDMQLIDEFKCESKEREKLLSYNRQYNLLYEFSTKKSLMPGNYHYVTELLKGLFKLWLSVYASGASSAEPDLIAWKIFEYPMDEASAIYSANGLASLLLYKKAMPAIGDGDASKNLTKVLLKLMFSIRQSIKMMKFETFAEFFKSKYYQDVGFSTASDVSESELNLLEIIAIFRFEGCEGNEFIAKLFEKLCETTEDPLLISQASLAINDEVLKLLDVERFKKTNKNLEKFAKSSKVANLEVSIALAINNYNLYFYNCEIATKMFQNCYESVAEGKFTKVVSIMNLNEEMELIKYLNESLRHFTDVIQHLMKHNEDSHQLVSIKRTMKLLDNISIQYHMRGIKYKDIEAQILLWHFCQLEDQPTILLNCGNFFIDNHDLLADGNGNYLKISKKMETPRIADILLKTNCVMDEFIKTFNVQTEDVQAYVLCYLLSLWLYYTIIGRKVDGWKQWTMFQELWKDFKTPEGSAPRQSLKAKIYFCLMEINLMCRKRNADNLLSHGIQMIMSVKQVDRNFSYQFQWIYNRITLKAINYSLNRHSDLDHYGNLMISLKALVCRKGHCFKALEMISISILRHLNMEKIDNAKIELQEITRLLGLKEEIFIATPKQKTEVPITVFDYDNQDIKVRKAVVAPDSPIQCEFSMIYEDQSNEMLSQLKKFIHELTCKCEICQYPQLRFIMFQIGCHYSRLLWLMDKNEICIEFVKFAVDIWRGLSDNLRRTKDFEFLQVKKSDFAVFSLRWLFQCADVLIKGGRYNDVEDIYMEATLLCTKDLTDYECFSQAIFCRKENLEHLIKYEVMEPPSPKTDASYSDFMKLKAEGQKFTGTRKKSPSPPVRTITKQKADKSDDIIYIDSSEEETFSSNVTAFKSAKSITTKTPGNESRLRETSSRRLLSKNDPKTPMPTIKSKSESDTTIETPLTRRTRRMI